MRLHEGPVDLQFDLLHLDLIEPFEVSLPNAGVACQVSSGRCTEIGPLIGGQPPELLENR